MNRIINAGICSYGMSGRVFHAPFLQAHPGFHLKGIVERHQNLSRERYPEATVFRSVKAMLEDNTIELVVVNTPVQTHFEYAKAALLAGKHIVVEKPFTVNAAEAKELNQLASEKQLQLIVYQNRRYDGDFLALKQVVAQGVLGELKEAEMRFDRYRPGHSGKNHKEGDQPGAGNLHDLGEYLQGGAIPSLSAWIATPNETDGVLHTVIQGEDLRKTTRSEIGNYMNFYEDVYQLLVNHEKNPVPATDGVMTMKIIDAALQSSKNRKVIPLEP